MTMQTFSLPSKILIIAMAMVLIVIPGNSFELCHSTQRRAELSNGIVAYRKRTSSLKAVEDQSSLLDRRSLLLLAGATITSAPAIISIKAIGNNLATNNNSSPAAILTRSTIQSSSADTGTTESTVKLTSVSSVEEALKIIASTCDKRFLHAMVASDYKFLYEGEESKTSSPSKINGIDAAGQIFSKKIPSGNGSVVLATTGRRMTTKNASSLWPLDGTAIDYLNNNNNKRGNIDTNSVDNGIHYAWSDQGGFLLSTNDDGSTTSKTLIVDGIDCGKMSLEDALEGDMQVLVKAPTFLRVPRYMELSLREGLQGAFLI
jgi:hypothetical protein